MAAIVDSQPAGDIYYVKLDVTIILKLSCYRFECSGRSNDSSVESGQSAIHLQASPKIGK